MGGGLLVTWVSTLVVLLDYSEGGTDDEQLRTAPVSPLSFLPSFTAPPSSPNTSEFPTELNSRLTVRFTTNDSSKRAVPQN